jgi:hypothetical protein
MTTFGFQGILGLRYGILDEDPKTKFEIEMKKLV